MKIKRKRVFLIIISAIIVLGGGYFGFMYFLGNNNNIEEYNVEDLSIQHQFLTVNPYSRSGDKLGRIKGVVIHYTANPGSTAQNNRDYFENLKDKHTTSVSSHFIIGLQGEVIQCVPLNEIAYASNNRNSDTISIECCHPDISGKFNDKTYNSLQTLVKSLMDTYHLNSNDIIRHYDVTGKNCPKYFVEHEDIWTQFKNSLK